MQYIIGDTELDSIISLSLSGFDIKTNSLYLKRASKKQLENPEFVVINSGYLDDDVFYNNWSYEKNSMGSSSMQIFDEIIFNIFACKDNLSKNYLGVNIFKNGGKEYLTYRKFLLLYQFALFASFDRIGYYSNSLFSKKHSLKVLFNNINRSSIFEIASFSLYITDMIYNEFKAYR